MNQKGEIAGDQAGYGRALQPGDDQNKKKVYIAYVNDSYDCYEKCNRDS